MQANFTSFFMNESYFVDTHKRRSADEPQRPAACDRGGHGGRDVFRSNPAVGGKDAAGDRRDAVAAR